MSMQQLTNMQYRQIDELQKLKGNPRVIKKEDFEKLKESIKNNPDYFEARPLVLSNRTGELVIIGGNQRYDAAKSLGLKDVPTHLIENLTEEREREIIIRDNVNNGSFDWDVLLNEWDTDQLDDWGLDIPEDFLDKKEVVEDDFDTTPPVEPKTKMGELWTLGDHRLLVGDSTKREDVERLMGGERADMSFSDPPYNVDYGAALETQREGIQNDKMSKTDFLEFCRGFSKNLVDYCDGAIYICMSSSELASLKTAFEDAGGHWQSFIIWAKNTFTLSRSDWQNQYEPILYGWRDGVVNHYFEGFRNQGNVWKQEPTDQELLKWAKSMITKTPTDVWEEKKPSKSPEHPCLPAGEMVNVDGVWKPIEDVQIGSWTNYGIVEDTSCHTADAVVEITLEDGNQTKATENHPFLVYNGEEIAWKSAGLLKDCDFILTNEKIHNTMKPLCIEKEADTLLKKDTDASCIEESLGCNIASYGNSITEQFRKDCKSITKTKINLIIELRISSLSLPLNTNGYTPIAKSETVLITSDVVNVESGNPSQTKIGISANKDGYTAENVEGVSSKESASVERFVLRKVGSVRTIREKTKVYNITIDGVPAFDTLIGVSHNTMKPIKLVAKAITASSLRGGW